MATGTPAGQQSRTVPYSYSLHIVPIHTFLTRKLVLPTHSHTPNYVQPLLFPSSPILGILAMCTLILRGPFVLLHSLSIINVIQTQFHEPSLEESAFYP